MIGVYIATLAVVTVGGIMFVLGAAWKADQLKTAIKLAEYLRYKANRDAGNLSKRIYKQRLKIKELQGQVVQLIGPEKIEQAKAERKARARDTYTRINVQPNLPH